MVATTLNISNSRDYSAAYLEKTVKRMKPQFFLDKAEQTHFYIVHDGNRIIGTGAIGSYWGSKTEYSLFDIFVLPTYQGQGIGELIIRTLEQDTYFQQAERVEIPASITAVDFYRHMGYALRRGTKLWTMSSFIVWKSFPKSSRQRSFHCSNRKGHRDVEKDYKFPVTRRVPERTRSNGEGWVDFPFRTTF